MTEPVDFLCVGGPLDGTITKTTAQVVYLAGQEDMAYIKTLPTDTNWRETYDHDWFMHGLDGPPPVPDQVLEWHERGWQSPEVRMIRDAVTEAAGRLSAGSSAEKP